MNHMNTSITDYNCGFADQVFQKIEKGKCRIALNGQIAIWTSHGYKTFSPKTGTLTNCSSFVSAFGDDFFYVVPAAKVKTGDIIIVNGTPRCVIKSEKKMLTVMTYETGAVEHMIPERQMFMGNIYFYHKIMSPMLGMFGSGKGKANRMIRMMMMSDMFRSSNQDASSGSHSGTAATSNSGCGFGSVAGGGMNFMQMLMMQGMMKDMGSSFEDLFDGFEDMDEDEDAADPAADEDAEDSIF